MKKIILFVLMPFFGLAQNDSINKKNDTIWKYSGDFSLLFSQSAFNNEWQNGGTSNYAANGIINYQINYKKEKWAWVTKILADYGITQADGQEYYRKTSDRFEINSVAGRQIKDTNWYFSFSLNALTQFDKGFAFDTDEEGNEIRSETTRFLSPGFFNFGPGILWKKDENLRVNLAPSSLRLITADKRFTTTEGYEDGDFFGLDRGAGLRTEFGASLNAYAKFKLMENITLENIFNAFTNYLQNTENLDLDYTLNLSMKVNEYISTNFTFQAIYDDNAVRGFQIRQVLGVGFSYKFN